MTGLTLGFRVHCHYPLIFLKSGKFHFKYQVRAVPLVDTIVVVRLLVDLRGRD
jgi:hypothetical protein